MLHEEQAKSVRAHEMRVQELEGKYRSEWTTRNPIPAPEKVLDLQASHQRQLQALRAGMQRIVEQTAQDMSRDSEAHRLAVELKEEEHRQRVDQAEAQAIEANRGALERQSTSTSELASEQSAQEAKIAELFSSYAQQAVTARATIARNCGLVEASIAHDVGATGIDWQRPVGSSWLEIVQIKAGMPAGQIAGLGAGFRLIAINGEVAKCEIKQEEKGLLNRLEKERPLVLLFEAGEQDLGEQRRTNAAAERAAEQATYDTKILNRQASYELQLSKLWSSTMQPMVVEPTSQNIVPDEVTGLQPATVMQQAENTLYEQTQSELAVEQDRKEDRERVDRAESVTTSAAVMCKVLFDYAAADDNELPLEVGRIVVATDVSDADWWEGYYSEASEGKPRKGFFPASFVEVTGSSAGTDGVSLLATNAMRAHEVFTMDEGSQMAEGVPPMREPLKVAVPVLERTKHTLLLKPDEKQQDSEEQDAIEGADDGTSSSEEEPLFNSLQ